MPVRKIPKNYLQVTGAFASRKNGRMLSFESLLEKEFMLLLEFDHTVERFEEQPVNIPLTGIPRGYTPDLLVHFFPNDGQCRQPMLVEVKHTTDLARHAEKYAIKFDAARLYALEHGWEFAIKTEQDIRTHRLSNLKFLRRFSDLDPAKNDCAAIIDLIASAGTGVPLHRVLAELGTAEADHLYWLPILWHMAITGKLHVNLDTPVDNSTLLYPPNFAP